MEETPSLDSMETVVLSFGSNYGNRRENVEKALAWVDSILTETMKSGVYETPEVHGFGASYYNAVACGKSSVGCDELNALQKEYEKACGRNEESRRRKEVPIDIDIVMWGDKIVRPVDFSREFFQIGLRQIKPVL